MLILITPVNLYYVIASFAHANVAWARKKEEKQVWLKTWKDYCSKKSLRWRPLVSSDASGANNPYLTTGTT